ncbi:MULTISPECIES: acyltransferase [unclassified Cobetia]|uniref:acyltransferase n=1 Tax=unclassified Cobetia TaxID=2609414 RepID=UPI00178C93A2|nr:MULTISPECIES: acyltransferase [unclassified Cobetia]MBE2170230.1 acyltransferase [Cobetia sp. 2AS1]MDH2446988.1 acyltransferase [Cobetia sp. 2AS]
MLNKFIKLFSRFNFCHLIFFILKGLYVTVFKKIRSKYYQYSYGYGKNFSLSPGARLAAPKSLNIGNNVSFENYAKAYYEDLGVLTIGNNSRIGRYSILDFTGGLTIGARVVVSESVKCYTHSHGHNPNNPPKGIHKIIGDDVWIGSNAIITENCTEIGSNSIVAAGSVVTKNIPSGCLYAGNPAKFIKTIR